MHYHRRLVHCNNNEAQLLILGRLLDFNSSHQILARSISKSISQEVKPKSDVQIKAINIGVIRDLWLDAGLYWIDNRLWRQPS